MLFPRLQRTIERWHRGGKGLRISGDTAGSRFKDKTGDFVKEKFRGLPQNESHALHTHSLSWKVDVRNCSYWTVSNTCETRLKMAPPARGVGLFWDKRFCGQLTSRQVSERNCRFILGISTSIYIYVYSWVVRLAHGTQCWSCFGSERLRSSHVSGWNNGAPLMVEAQKLLGNFCCTPTLH